MEEDGPDLCPPGPGETAAIVEPDILITVSLPSGMITATYSIALR
jgi:hypothetical protein